MGRNNQRSIFLYAINGDRFRATITKVEVEVRELDKIWFQKDGGSSHTLQKPMDLLKILFG